MISQLLTIRFAMNFCFRFFFNFRVFLTNFTRLAAPYSNSARSRSQAFFCMETNANKKTCLPPPEKMNNLNIWKIDFNFAAAVLIAPGQKLHE